MSDYDRILGTLICDRVGLDPNRVARDGFTYEVASPSTVIIHAPTVHFITAEDLLELQAIAHARYMAGQPVG
jgi:hypothetical protein